jgi:hypothetical protein
MIDIEGKIKKERLRASLQRRWTVLQNKFEKELRTVIRSQYYAAARNVDAYELDFYYTLEQYNKRLRNIFRKYYKIIAVEFGEKMLEETQKNFIRYEQKGLIDDFWRFVIGWIATQVGNKIRIVQRTTRLAIQRIVKKGIEEGKTNNEIAKQIRTTSSIIAPFRAKRIARTETHTTVNYAMTEAMGQTGLIQEKEWLSAKDDRTRHGKFDHVGANGERVALDDTFKRTGENLEYPGDPDGSVGNIVNCRCISLFHTKRKVA